MLGEAGLFRRSTAYAQPFMETVAAVGMVGQPAFYLVWGYLLPQPYENLALRLAAGLVCLPVVLRRYWPARLGGALGAWWLFGVFVNIPLVFSFLLLQNHLSQVWVLSMLVGAFLLTFLVNWLSSLALFVAGGAAARALHVALDPAPVPLPAYLEIELICTFALVLGGAVNHRLTLYRRNEREFEKKMISISNQNKNLAKQYNQLLSRFLNNTIVHRLVQLQDRHGLAEALRIITRQERRFCGIMQADARNFTKLFGAETEFQVAQLISRCFNEVTETGQDFAVIKPIGDGIFIYCDEADRAAAVRNVLNLAFLLVQTVERINRTLIPPDAAPLNFGVALHAGEVIYGNLASDNLIDPTVVGLNVNQTARLEELTKSPRLQEIVGPNAIILSEAFAELAAPFLEPEETLAVELDRLSLSVRDFPEIRRVRVIPHAVAAARYPPAEQHLALQRPAGALHFDVVSRNTYNGVDYYYEMQGVGPELTWEILIDVSGFSRPLVDSVADRDLPGLDCQVRDRDGTWMIISTGNAPGEYDEVDVEETIIRVIEHLLATGPPTPPERDPVLN